MSRLAEIYKNEKVEGRSKMSAFSSTIGKGMKESIDPRQLLDQKGLFASMFPSLKAYNATGEKKEKIIDDKRKVSLENLDKLTSKQLFQKILITSQTTVKNTSVLPAAAKDLKAINVSLLKLLKFAEEGGFSGEGNDQERSMLETILDALGLGDLIPDKGGGKSGRGKGAKDRLKRMQQSRAARTAAAAAAGAGAASAVPKPTPTPEVKPNAVQGKGKPPAGAKWDEKANRWRGANGRFVKAEIPKETLKGLIQSKVGSVSGKIIPGLGIGFGVYDIYQRIKKDDYTGIGIAAGSAVASLFPGIGTGVAIAGTAANIARDIYEEAYGVYPEKDEEGDVQQKYTELLDMIMEELTGKKVQPLSEEQYNALIPMLTEVSNTTRERRKILLNRPNGIYDKASKLGINRDTVDNEMQNLKNEKAAAIQNEQSKLLEQLTTSVKTAPTSSETSAASPTTSPIPVGASDTPSSEGPAIVPTTTTSPAASGAAPTSSTPTLRPGEVSGKIRSSEMPSQPTSGAAISSASSAVSDAQLTEARTPIVTTMPATSSTPRPRVVDSAPAAEIASVYNEELMKDIFGNRQQAFA
jgi:hypothetical protein